MTNSRLRLAWRASGQLKYLAVSAILTACASIADIDTSKAEPICVRGCSDRYSSCAGVTLATTATLQACKESFQVCIKSCPAK